MKRFTIENFWSVRLPAEKPSAPQVLPGWYANTSGVETFVEAPLTRSESLSGEDDPNTSKIILVSAPGAVGKSTLARQISASTGAAYLDLAEAEPVGGNTLSGGLVKSGILAEWQSDSAALLIDGLDEARLKVTQEGFEAFLADIAYQCRDRSTPTVLFGRTGAIQDAWLLLSDEVSVTVLEIGYYPPDIALNFAKAQLRAATSDHSHIETGDRAITILLDRLRDDTQNDGDRFAGYAPVLEAVANRVARENNPIALISQVEKGQQPVTLQTVIDAILYREQQKLQSITFEDEKLKDLLYKPKEQLDRLVAQVYRRSTPPLPAMSPNDAQTYSAALETWVLEHPFLETTSNPASAVFDAVITSAALRNTDTANLATTKELAKGAAANPFLAEFYLGEGNNISIPPEHIGVVYASMRARLSLGDSASLSVDGIEDADELEQLKSNVEINIHRFGDDIIRTLSFDSDQAGVIRLGSHVEDVDISAALADVEIGGAREATLVAPVSIQCLKLIFSTERIIVERSPSMPESSVALEAEQAETSALVSTPLINGTVTLSVSWQGAEAYPWTSFRGTPTVAQDPRTDEALRRFRKFVISFRSHSKGSLKRYAAKIEHERMTKGTGSAILQYMLKTKILTNDGAMYTLDPIALSEQTGASYTLAMSRTFPDKTIEFITHAINQ